MWEGSAVVGIPVTKNGEISGLALFAEQRIEVCERAVTGLGGILSAFAACTAGCDSGEVLFEFLVLVVVAVQAQQLPIAAVRGVVVVIHVFVVDSQLPQGGMVELTSAATAYPCEKLQGLLPIPGGAFIAAAARIRDHTVELIGVDGAASAAMPWRLFGNTSGLLNRWKCTHRTVSLPPRPAE